MAIVSATTWRGRRGRLLTWDRRAVSPDLACALPETSMSACLVAVAAWSDGYASVASFHGAQWMAVVYLGVFGGAAAFFLWVFALERTTPTRTAITLTINPVFASAVGALTLGEPIGINLV